LWAIVIFRLGILRLLNIRFNGTTYSKPLRYFIIRTVSLPWGPISTSDNFTREDMLANSLTFYRNSFISFNNLMRTHFPVYSKMTVWYDPEKPNRAYVERYCGINKLYKLLGVGSAILLIMVYAVVCACLFVKEVR